MRNIFLGVIFCGFILFSCESKPGRIDVPSGFDGKRLVEMMKNPEAFPKQEIAGIAGTETDKIKIYNENFSSGISKRTVLFSWPDGEMKTIKTMDGKELKVENHRSLGIGFVRKISKDDFLKQFESKEFIQNQINSIAENEEIPADIAIAEAINLAENAKIQKFEKLENIGETAYWESPVNALHVFANGIAFTVSTNLETEQESREKAVQLVQLIFDNSSN